MQKIKNKSKKKLSLYAKVKKALIIIAKILKDIYQEKQKQLKSFFKKIFRNIKRVFKFTNKCFDFLLDYMLDKVCRNDFDDTIIIDISEYLIEQKKIVERTKKLK